MTFLREMRASTTRLLALFGAAALVCAPACDEEVPPESVGMSVSVYTAASGADPFANVVKMWAYVDGDDLNPIEHTSETLYKGTGSLTLPSIPFSPTSGHERQLTIEGWGVDQATGTQYLVSRGRTLSTIIAEGLLAPFTLSAYLVRVNAFAPLADAVTRQSQFLFEGRVGHTATRTDLDEVVIAGGGAVSGVGPGADGGTAWWTPEGFDTRLRTLEVLDEATHTHRPIVPGADGAKQLFFDRVWHSATAIHTGQVFFAGGWGTVKDSDTGEDKAIALHSVEVYSPITASNPAEKVDVLQANLAKARAGHSATLVDEENFVVLFVGGDEDGEATYEVWNPITGSTGDKPLPDGVHRRFHAATYFEATDPSQPLGSQGRPAVIITGGETSEGLGGEGAPDKCTEQGQRVLGSFLIYDILTDAMLEQPGCMPKGPRTQLTASFVKDQGKIYVVGGYTSIDRLKASNAIDVFEAASTEPAYKDNVSGFNLKSSRGGHTATMMNDGAVLVAGGSDATGSLSSIEIIHQYYKEELNEAGVKVLNPYITVAFACEEGCPNIPAMPAGRVGHRAVFLERGLALLIGGAAGGDAGGVTPLNLVSDLTVYSPQ